MGIGTRILSSSSKKMISCRNRLGCLLVPLMSSSHQYRIKAYLTHKVSACLYAPSPLQSFQTRHPANRCPTLPSTSNPTTLRTSCNLLDLYKELHKISIYHSQYPLTLALSQEAVSLRYRYSIKGYDSLYLQALDCLTQMVDSKVVRHCFVTKNRQKQEIWEVVSFYTDKKVTVKEPIMKAQLIEGAWIYRHFKGHVKNEPILVNIKGMKLQQLAFWLIRKFSDKTQQETNNVRSNPFHYHSEQKLIAQRIQDRVSLNTPTDKVQASPQMKVQDHQAKGIYKPAQQIPTITNEKVNLKPQERFKADLYEQDHVRRPAMANGKPYKKQLMDSYEQSNQQSSGTQSHKKQQFNPEVKVHDFAVDQPSEKPQVMAHAKPKKVHMKFNNNPYERESYDQAQAYQPENDVYADRCKQQQSDEGYLDEKDGERIKFHRSQQNDSVQDYYNDPKYYQQEQDQYLFKARSGDSSI